MEFYPEKLENYRLHNRLLLRNHCATNVPLIVQLQAYEAEQ